MTDCFDNLPRWARDKLQAPPGHKDWMQCRSCHVYKDVAILKKCGGCSTYRIEPIYYCSKECQKRYCTVPRSMIHSRLKLGSSDWVSHKGDCKIFQERGKREKDGEISTGNANQKKLAKMLYQWIEVNTQTVVSARTIEIVNVEVDLYFANNKFWSMAHAYHYNKEADPAKVVFDVVLDIESFQITSFRFGLKTDPRYRGFFSESPFSHLQGSDKQWFCVMVNQNMDGPADYFFSMQWTPVGRKHKDWITEDDGAPFPEWPWIAVHLTRQDEKRGWAAKMKWNLLITAVHLLRLKFVGSFDKFTAPKLEIGVTFSPPDMDFWYKKLNRRLIWDAMVQGGYVKKTFDRFAQA